MAKTKKYRKQKQHYRRFKTTGKKVLVNKGVKYKVSSKKGTLSQSKREVITGLNKFPYEIGGHLDFGNRGLEYSTQNYGTSASVYIDEDPDYEVTYHTHPMLGKPYLDTLNYFPSPTDLITLHDSDDQAQIIVHDKSMTIVNPLKKFKTKLPSEVEKDIFNLEKELKQKVKEMMLTKQSINQIVDEARKIFKKYGLKLTFIPKDKEGTVGIPIKVVERAQGKKVSSREDEVYITLSGYNKAIKELSKRGNKKGSEVVMRLRNEYKKKLGVI